MLKLSTQQCIPSDTERLSFRLLTLNDAEAWKSFVLSDEAMQYFAFPKVESESFAWIERQIQRYKDNRGGLMAVIEKESGLLVGQCGLLVQDLEGEEVLEVGYSFLPEYWGKGFASESAAAFYKLGLALNPGHSILSVIHVDNVASQRVAEKNGLILIKETIWKETPVQVWGVGNGE